MSKKTDNHITTNPWRFATYLLVILLVISIYISIYTSGFSSIDFSLGSDGSTKLGDALKQYQDQVAKAATIGDEDAPVLIVEFSDFQCPYCKKFYTETYSQIMENYVKTGKVILAYKHFPLSFHQNAQKAAEAFECAGDQGKFWEYHDILFDKGTGDGTGLFVDDLKKYAKDLGLDESKFNECLDSGAKTEYVKKDFTDGQALGVSGTPSFLINGEKVVGAQPYAAIATIIDKKLAGDNTIPTQPVAQPTPAAAPTRVTNPSVDDDAMKGDKDAQVTIIEFSDFQCPYCKRHFQQTMPSLQKEYIDTGKVRYVFRDYVLSFHKAAQKAGEAAECAGDQGKFWEYHDTLFEKGESDGTGLAVDDLKQYAKDLKLDTVKFNDCLTSGKYEQETKDDMAEGQKYGITGTPGFLINGIPVKGAQPFANFKKIIDEELANN